MPLVNTLKNVKNPHRKQPPLWKGPGSNEPQGGVTQSLLSRYLCCAERFRIMTIEGLRPPESFSQRMEYGNMWHICEEFYAKGQDWKQPLQKYCKRLAQRFAAQGSEVEHWYNVCATQFPIYVAYWRKHPDSKKRKAVVEERTFNVPVPLPSGRVAYLRGKWDSIDIVAGKLRLQENKTKGDIDEQQTKRNLVFDLQTGLYSVAFEEALKDPKAAGIPELLTVGAKHRHLTGVRYNVVRRPLSGGLHSIRQHKPTKSNPAGESAEEFYKRLGGLIETAVEEGSGEHYFFKRWDVDLLPGDLDKFRQQFLYPVLENLIDDYEWWYWAYSKDEDPFDFSTRLCIFQNHYRRHFRFPYGVYNPTLEGNATELDEYLLTGNRVGLERAKDLFKELHLADSTENDEQAP